MVIFNRPFKFLVITLILSLQALFHLVSLYAEPLPTWNIVSAKSSIQFTATQNDAPVTGQFKNFTGDIHFDPQNLRTSHIKIVVDLGSVTSTYAQIAETLKASDWFDIKNFPKATFTAVQFKKTGENTYQAQGSLTLRAKTLPLILDFTLVNYTKETALAIGKATLQRMAFGVGQGEWANTNTIKDSIQITFTLAATTKKL